MEFRWVAGLTLWTMLSGPILSQPAPPRPVALARPVFVAPPPKPLLPATPSKATKPVMR